MKDEHTYGIKMARKGRSKVIYKGIFVSKRSLILKKLFFFQCLALPKDPQSFGSQNLRCPFLQTSETVNRFYKIISNLIFLIELVILKTSSLSHKNYCQKVLFFIETVKF